MIINTSVYYLRHSGHNLKGVRFIYGSRNICSSRVKRVEVRLGFYTRYRVSILYRYDIDIKS
jgi:peptidoglycan/xylan/chitin deacetylase (PgdA/CDA1 family)